MKRYAAIPRQPRPRPFVVVDANGSPCGLYQSIDDATHARDFLNEYGVNAPYRIPPASHSWRPAA